LEDFLDDEDEFLEDDDFDEKMEEFEKMDDLMIDEIRLIRI